MVANFGACLAASKTPSKRKQAEDVLSRLYPGEPIKWNDAPGNDGGTDVVVGDKRVDLKYRSKDYGQADLALEIWSHWEKRKVGWTRDATKNTDLVLWLWTDSGRYELLPFGPLCKAYQANGENWMRSYKTSKQANQGYTSYANFVPIQVVRAAIAALPTDDME